MSLSVLKSIGAVRSQYSTVQNILTRRTLEVTISLVVREVDGLDWTGVSRTFSGACVFCVFQLALYCCP